MTRLVAWKESEMENNEACYCVLAKTVQKK